MNLREHWRKNLVGHIAPMCTSFNGDYSLNPDGFRRHVRYLLDHGFRDERCGMILVSGAAGEHPSLSFDERKELLEIAVEEANGEVPVLFGATATHTMESIRLARMAEEVGATGLQMSMPYYEPPTWEDTKAFYRELNDSIGIGVMDAQGMPTNRHMARCGGANDDQRDGHGDAAALTVPLSTN